MVTPRMKAGSDRKALGASYDFHDGTGTAPRTRGKRAPGRDEAGTSNTNPLMWQYGGHMGCRELHRRVGIYAHLAICRSEPVRKKENAERHDAGNGEDAGVHFFSGFVPLQRRDVGEVAGK